MIFLLSVVSHFVYDWMPNTVFSILFPVNESIWEHMKLIATPVLLFSIGEYFIYRKKGIHYPNFLLSYSFAIFIGILSYLGVYMPIHYLFGHSLVVSILLLFLTFMEIEVISYSIMHVKKIRYGKILGLGLLFFIYILFGYLTYYPYENELFYDTVKKGYGLMK